MLRHPHDLEIPWNMQWHRVTTGPHHHLGWLIALLVMLARFLIGLEVRGRLIWRHQQ